MERVTLKDSTDSSNWADLGKDGVPGNWKYYEICQHEFPLHKATQLGDIQAMKDYIHGRRGCYRIEVDKRDSAGRSPMHVAVMYRRDNSIELLLEHRPDLEIKDDDVLLLKRDFS